MPAHLKPALLLALLQGRREGGAGLHARPSIAPIGWRSIWRGHGVNVQRIHGNRSQAQRTEALAGFKSGKYRVLVATDIAARGIDVTALGHVINFDVPVVPEDYIHRVGRTARAELTGSAFTLVAPEDEGSLRAIERAINKRLPRVTVPDFDYKARAEQRLEVPHAQRIAEIRARKAEERQRARANAERRARNAASPAPQPGATPLPAAPRTATARTSSAAEQCALERSASAGEADDRRTRTVRRRPPPRYYY